LAFRKRLAHLIAILQLAGGHPLAFSSGGQMLRRRFDDDVVDAQVTTLACFIVKQLGYVAAIRALPYQGKPRNVGAVHFITWILIANCYHEHLSPATTDNRLQRLCRIICNIPSRIVSILVDLEICMARFAMGKEHRIIDSFEEDKLSMPIWTLDTLMGIIRW
jgi:hypothetical protein